MIIFMLTEKKYIAFAPFYRLIRFFNVCDINFLGCSYLPTSDIPRKETMPLPKGLVPNR